MSGAYISIILILSVVFIIIMISSLLKSQSSCIYASISEEADNIEGEIREMLWKNPDSEIVVVIYGKSIEAVEILKMLEKDFPRLHIIKK